MFLLPEAEHRTVPTMETFSLSAMPSRSTPAAFRARMPILLVNSSVSSRRTRCSVVNLTVAAVS